MHLTLEINKTDPVEGICPQILVRISANVGESVRAYCEIVSNRTENGFHLLSSSASSPLI